MKQHIRALLKRGFQHAAANLGKHRFSLSDEPEMLILMYHRILPADDPRLAFEEPGMAVTPESFEQHLEAIKKEFEIVDLDDWVERRQTGQSLPEKSCAITFDDGWADNYEFAYPLLKKHGIPATIFLVAEMIGTDHKFWPERVARLLVAVARSCPEQWSHASLDWIPRSGTDYAFDASQPDREQLSSIIGQCKHLDDDTLHRSIDVACEALGLDISTEQASLLDWSQVREMADSGVIHFGSHTCTHARLNAQTPVHEMKHQVADSKAMLRDRLGVKAELFCFPNGDYTDETLEFVIRHYNAAVTTARGWNVKSSDSHRLRRVGVHQDAAHDRTAFLACISDWV